MKRILNSIALIWITGLSFLPASTNSQVHQEWITRTDSLTPSGIVVDRSGNVYVTGTIFRGTSGFNMALVKYDAKGIQQWMREYNGIGDDLDAPTAIALDTNGNIFITGYSFRGPAVTNDEIVTIKYNPSGDSLWVRHYNSPGTLIDRAFALAVDTARNAYVGGYLRNISFGNVYGQDYITIKYTPDGTQSWAVSYGVFSGSVTALAVDRGGNVIVTGVGFASSTSVYSDYVTIKYSSGGAVLWLKRFDGGGDGSETAQGIAVDDSGYVYVTGTSADANGYYDYATVKYDGAGGETWARRYDGPVHEDDKAIGVVVDKNLDVYVTGEASVVSGSFVRDFATVKYGRDGDTLWVKLYDGPGHSIDRPVDLTIGNDASIYITGRSIGEGFSGYMDYATIKYGTNGDSLWVQRYNPADLEDQAAAVEVDQSGNVYVTGADQVSFTSGGSATIKYSQPLAQSLAIPALGTGSTTPFGSALVTFIGDVSVSDSVTVYYYLDPPIPGTLPSGIIRIGDFYWRVSNGGTLFTNGFMRISTEDFLRVTVGGCGACLVWLKRDNPGDPWQNIGGSLTGTLTLGTLISTIPFNSFSEFAIGSTDSMTLDVPEISGPSVFGLAQNYPNPFNPTTEIRYTLAAAGHVSLRVFDVLGKLVATLVHGNEQAGSKSVTFHAHGLASGVYYYRLQTDGQSLTRKLLVIR